MLKKTLIITLLLFLNTLHAETCPTPKILRTSELPPNAWQALNINSAEPLSEAQWKKMKKHIKLFSMAQWRPDAPEGAGQCYYKQDLAGFELEVYLAKNTFAPDKKSAYWHTVNNVVQCDISLIECRFEDHA